MLTLRDYAESNETSVQFKIFGLHKLASYDVYCRMRKVRSLVNELNNYFFSIANALNNQVISKWSGFLSFGVMNDNEMCGKFLHYVDCTLSKHIKILKLFETTFPTTLRYSSKVVECLQDQFNLDIHNPNYEHLNGKRRYKDVQRFVQ